MVFRGAVREPRPQCGPGGLRKPRAPVPRSSPVPALRSAACRPTDRRRCRSEEHTSELQSPCNLVCRLLLEKKKTTQQHTVHSPHTILYIIKHADTRVT